MLGLVILSPRLLSILRLGTILLKSVLNVSASSTLIVIVLLLSFNVIHDDIDDFEIWVSDIFWSSAKYLGKMSCLY